MKKTRALTGFYHGRNFKTGDIGEFSDSVAEQLVNAGLVEYSKGAVDDEEKKTSAADGSKLSASPAAQVSQQKTPKKQGSGATKTQKKEQ